jgi:YgiT-type zinc finger domain-containing protein
MNLIAEIRAKIAADVFEFSQHAVDQSITRGIGVTEIREAVAMGEVIEDYPNDKYGPSCLVFGTTGQAAARSMQLPIAPNPQDHYRIRARSRSVDPVPATEVAQPMSKENGDRLVQSLVTYSVEYQGSIIIIENVPARVDPETGERFYSPETVEQIQAIVWSDRQPDRMAQTPVFQFAA